LDTQAALNGDVVALISVLDYIVSQISPAGGVFDMLQTLKLGEHLGLSWYDNIIGGLQSSQYFPQLAQAVGDFANTIDDVDVLYDASKPGQRAGDSPRVYGLMEGNARKVFGNFSRKYDSRPPSGGIPDVIQFGDPGNPTTMTLYESAGGLPTVRIDGPFGPSDSWRKIRFGKW
jgi:hypothetical protein